MRKVEFRTCSGASVPRGDGGGMEWSDEPVKPSVVLDASVSTPSPSRADATSGEVLVAPARSGAGRSLRSAHSVPQGLPAIVCDDAGDASASQHGIAHCSSAVQTGATSAATTNISNVTPPERRSETRGGLLPLGIIVMPVSNLDRAKISSVVVPHVPR